MNNIQKKSLKLGETDAETYTNQDEKKNDCEKSEDNWIMKWKKKQIRPEIVAAILLCGK